ncbi:MAG: cytochrome c oxidase subunit 3 [Candidatus Cyclobacteriaceae bacterium M3_2C_046]
MAQQINLLETPKYPLSMHPKKFALWLFMVSVVMIFASLTSAYIVRQADGNWLEFQLPPIFFITTGIILLSSISMHWAYISARKDQLDQVKIGLAITGIIGVAFLIGQIMGWSRLVQMDVYFVGNPAGSFVYVLSGVHGLHIVSSIVFVLVVLLATFRYKVHSKNMIRIEMLTTYWHFLGGLWIYLFLFLWLNN